MKRGLAVVFLFALAISANAGPRGAWRVLEQYNNGVTLKPLKGGEVQFDVPTGEGHVNQIEREWNPPVAPNATISITYRIVATSGKPEFRALDKGSPGNPGLPPNCRPMIFNGDWASSWGRFWPTGTNCIWLVADGQVHTYTAKLDQKTWTAVFGQTDPKSFKKVCAKVYAFQLCFSGGNSFSHGARVRKGTARFELIRFKVN